MATRTRSRYDGDEHRGTRSLSAQPIRFLGLFLAPFGGLIIAWLLHVYVRGVHLSWGRLDVETSGSLAGLVVLSSLLSVGGVGLGISAFHFADHRKPFVRWSLALSTGAVVWMFAVSVGVGPHRVWSLIYILVAYYVAGTWSLARLDATRERKGESAESEAKLPGWIDGLKGYAARKVNRITDESGDVVRTEIHLKSKDGGTIGPVNDAVPNLESLAGAPAGLSDAAPTDRADETVVNVLHSDPLAKSPVFGPAPYDGSSIEEPILMGTYKTGHPVWCYLGGGPVSINPTGYIFVGMSRSGKTGGENVMFTDVIGRTDVVIMYMNMAKGLQDIRPIVPGVEVAIITESQADYRSAYERVKKLMTYRSNILGEYGISAWSANRCFHNPPTHKADGTLAPMAPMPLLVVHAGEADAILDRADDEAVYVASKGLSLGVLAGFSLQRGMADSMPTSLRENLGLRFCFGVGNFNSASHVMSDAALKNVDPYQWNARHPGRFIVEGPGIEERMFNKYARTPGRAPGMTGTETPPELSSAMQEEMLRRNIRNAANQARLDRGSALAMGADGPRSWWDLRVADTDRIRRSLLGDRAVPKSATADADEVATAGASASANRPATAGASEGSATRRSQTAAGPYDDEEDDDDMQSFTTGPASEDADTAEARSEIQEEMDATREIGGVPLYPDYGDDGSAFSIDLDEPIPPAPEGHSLSWEDPRPVAPSRNDARLALLDVLASLFLDPGLADPADPTGNTVVFRVGHVHSRYPFRTRPWFSGELSRLADNPADLPEGWEFGEAEEFPVHNRHYRLRRPRADGA